MLTEPLDFARRVVGRVLDVTVPPVADAILRRVDINRVILTRVDLIPLTQYVIDGVDLPAIIRQSSSTLTTAAVQGVRERGVNADDAIARAFDHLIPGRRSNGRAGVISDG